MNICLRLLHSQVEQIHEDLSRPHLFAFERVGFLTCTAAGLPDEGILLLGHTWHSVADRDYVCDRSVGACIGPAAFRKVLQIAYRDPVAILHVHRHEHRGPPLFSMTDEESMTEFVPGFFNARPTLPHGALLLSQDSVAGAIWLAPGRDRHALDRFDLVGIAPSRRYS